MLTRALASLLSFALTLVSVPASAAGPIVAPQVGTQVTAPAIPVYQGSQGTLSYRPAATAPSLPGAFGASTSLPRKGGNGFQISGARSQAESHGDFSSAGSEGTQSPTLSLAEHSDTLLSLPASADVAEIQEVHDRIFTKSRESAPLAVSTVEPLVVSSRYAPARSFTGFNGAAEKAPEPAKPAKTVADLGAPSYDFDKMFDLTRKLMTRTEVRVFLRESFREELEVTPEMQKKYGLPEKIKELSESQFMFLLQYNSKHWPVLEQYLTEMAKLDKKDQDSPAVKEKEKEWRATFRELLAKKDLARVFKVLNDPTKSMQLRMPGDQAGYRNVQVFANHPAIKDGKEVPGQDLKQVVLDFIAGSKKKLMLNVFDFDLMDVADALAAKAADGVEVTVGIDKNTIATRPEVKAVFDRLKKAKGLTVVDVDSVGLNHQKLFTRDWDDKEKAATLFSSGNLTQSCIGPEGDLKDDPNRPKDSIPNANHMIVVEGWLPAQVAAHSLIKTLVMKLRGDEYPLGGAVTVFGPKAPEKDRHFMLMAFSPKGGLGDINRDVTQRVLSETRGPVRMMQFAFSSATLEDAIVERAKLEKKDGKTFDFKSIGDTPFAMRPWSVFLGLSGYELDESKETKEYKKTRDPPLKEALGAEAFEKVKENIRVGPRAYRNHAGVKDAEGKSTAYNAKIHHKVLTSGPVAIAGTSFNFSENANSNNEQFVLFKDPEVVAEINAMFDGLFKQSEASVEQEALRRNELFKNKEDAGDDKDDAETRHIDDEGKKSRRVKPSDTENGAVGRGPSFFSDPVFIAELKRKVFHQATLIYLAGYTLLGAETSLYAVAAWAAALGTVETARLRIPAVRHLFQKAFGMLIREKESNRYTGAMYTSLGAGAVIALYGSHPTIVAASILYLAFGDAASALVGRAIGRHKYKVMGETRSLEGTLAGFVTALAIGAVLGLSPVITLIGAIAFLIADTLPLKPDDNLWIPLITGTVLYFLGV